MAPARIFSCSIALLTPRVHPFTVQKWLVDADGRVVKRYGPRTAAIRVEPDAVSWLATSIRHHARQLP